MSTPKSKRSRSRLKKTCAPSPPPLWAPWPPFPAGPDRYPPACRCRVAGECRAVRRDQLLRESSSPALLQPATALRVLLQRADHQQRRNPPAAAPKDRPLEAGRHPKRNHQSTPPATPRPAPVHMAGHRQHWALRRPPAAHLPPEERAWEEAAAALRPDLPRHPGLAVAALLEPPTLLHQLAARHHPRLVALLQRPRQRQGLHHRHRLQHQLNQRRRSRCHLRRRPPVLLGRRRRQQRVHLLRVLLRCRVWCRQRQRSGVRRVLRCLR